MFWLRFDLAVVVVEMGGRGRDGSAASATSLPWPCRQFVTNLLPLC